VRSLLFCFIGDHAINPRNQSIEIYCSNFISQFSSTFSSRFKNESESNLQEIMLFADGECLIRMAKNFR
jgi:hypothetical protein